MLSRIPAPYQRLLTIALPVLSLLLAYFLTVPRYLELKKDEAELARTDEFVRAKRLSVDEAAQQKSGPVVAQLPADRNEPVQFLRELNTVAGSYGVRLTNVTTAAPIEQNTPPPTSAGGAGAAGTAPPKVTLPPGTTPVILQVDVEGTYPGLAQFFRRLETYPRLISVTDVSMSATAGDYPKIKAQFRLTRYTGTVTAGTPVSQPAAGQTPAPAAAPASPGTGGDVGFGVQTVR